MKIMQINNNYPTKYNSNFESRKLPKKWALREVSEDTLKKVSAAITSTGIASMLLGQSNDDYIESIATPIDRLDFSNEDMKVLEEGYEISPILMDTLLSAKDRYNAIRDFHKEQIEQLLPAYDINPDLTSELLVEKKNDGNFKYRIQDIVNIVNAYELAPELLEPAKKHPTFVNSLINAKNNNNEPCYGLDDIIQYTELYEADKEFATSLFKQHGINGNQRFNGSEAKNIYKNKTNEFMQYLLKLKNRGTSSYYRLNGNDVIKVFNLCKTKEEQETAKTLFEATFKDPWGALLPVLIPTEVTDAVKYSSYKFASKYCDNMDTTKLLQVLKLKKDITTDEEVMNIYQLKNKRGQYIFLKNNLDSLLAIKAQK